MIWQLHFRGGPWDKREERVDLSEQPREVIVVWFCGSGPEWDCYGHASFDVNDPNIVFGTTTAYRRSSMDADERVAVYDVGEGFGGENEREAAEELNRREPVAA